MAEVLENVIHMMHSAPDKRLEIAKIIEKYRDDGIITLLPLEQLKMFKQDVEIILKKGLN
jgi:hypothetical protein